MKQCYARALRWFILCPLVLICSQITYPQNSSALLTVKQYVQNHKVKLGVTDKDVASLFLTYEYVDKTTGIHHMYATQRINGLTVTGSNFSLHTTGSMQTDANR